jgi:hypothetical protein
MGETRSTYGREETCIQGFGMENLKEIDHLEDPGVYGSIIFRWIFRRGDVEAWTGSIWLKKGKDGASVNAEMNLRDP